MRVLVIEDSPRLQRSLGAGLRRSGYAVDTAGDGGEGLLMAESNSYDVIFLDIMLPKLDGFNGRGIEVVNDREHHRFGTALLYPQTAAM